jgi:hypothetical protein
MQHSEVGEGKSGRLVGIEAWEGGGHAFISELDYRDLEIMKRSVNLSGDLAHIL